MFQRQGAQSLRNEAYFFVGSIACPGEGRGRMQRNAAYEHFTKSLSGIVLPCRPYHNLAHINIRRLG
jgi:hypothetical protein